MKKISSSSTGLINNLNGLKESKSVSEVSAIKRKQIIDDLSSYKYLCDNISDLVFICDTYSNILYINRIAEKFTGHKPEELIGKPFAGLFDSENQKVVTSKHKETLDGKEAFCEIRFKNTGIICEGNCAPLIEKDGRISGVIGIARDITLRTKEFQKYEEKLKAILDSIHDFIFIFDRYGTFLDFFGPKDSIKLFLPPEKFLGRNYRDTMPSHFVELLDNALAILLSKKEPQSFDYSLTINNDVSWFNAKISINYNRKKEFTGFTAVVRDISERKKLEEELAFLYALTNKISEAESFSAALRLSVSSICRKTGWCYGEAWIPEPDGEYLAHCPACTLKSEDTIKFSQLSEDITFGPGEGLPGRVWQSKKAEWIPDVSVSPESLFLRAEIAKKCNLKAGFAVPLVSSGHVIAVLCFFMNRARAEDKHLVELVSTVAAQLGAVLMRKNVEDKLRDSEMKYRHFMESANDAIFIADAETGIILNANQKAQKLTGLTMNEIVGMHQTKLHPPEHAEKYRKRFKKDVEDKNVTTSDNYVYHKDGHLIPVEISSSVSDFHGKKVIQGIFRDITDRKLAEEKLIESRRQLQLLTAHLHDSIENERKHISREIHDELGQFLSVIKMDLQMLEKKIPADPNKIHNDFRVILRHIDSSIEITRKIALNLRPGLLDFAGLAPAIENHVNDFRKRTGIKCTLSFNKTKISIDQSLSIAVFRMLQEALTNIARHSGATEVKVRLGCTSKAVTLDISDNGMGIPEKEMSSPASIGLIGMMERAEHFGGSMNIKTRKNRGTALSFKIPLGKKKPRNDKDTDR